MIVIIHIIRIAFIAAHLLVGVMNPHASARERQAGRIVTVSVTADIRLERGEESIFIPFPTRGVMRGSAGPRRRLREIEVLLESKETTILMRFEDEAGKKSSLVRISIEATP